MTFEAFLNSPGWVIAAAAAAGVAALGAAWVMGFGRRGVRGGGDLEALVDSLTTLSRVSVKQGAAMLPASVARDADPFLHRAADLVARGASPVHIKTILEHDADVSLARSARWAELMGSWPRFLPAVGVVVLVVALVGMARVGVPSEGVSTWWAGMVFGAALLGMLMLVVRLPDSESLTQAAAASAMSRMLIVTAAVSMRNGESPEVLHQRLRGMLPGGVGHAEAGASSTPKAEAA